MLYTSLYLAHNRLIDNKFTQKIKIENLKPIKYPNSQIILSTIG
jgi:hypothetical protein